MEFGRQVSGHSTNPCPHSQGIPAQTARNLLQTAVPPDSQEVTAEVTDGQAQATSLCDMARCKISYAETANVLEESRGAGGGDKDKFTDYADRLTVSTFGNVYSV